MQGKHGHLSREQKQLALRLYAKGWRLADIAKEIGCSAPMVGIMARAGRHVHGKPFGWEPRAGSLTMLVLDALEHAFFTRGQAGITDLSGLVIPSDAGSV